MRIGVLADSHDHLEHLRRAVEVLGSRGVEAVIHAGDFVAPFTVPLLGRLGVPVHGVFGNNDGERVGLKARFAEIGAQVQERPQELHLGGHRILVQHEPFGLETLAASAAWPLVIYGHTHQVDLREGACTILNPGEVCGWLTGRPTMALVDLATRAVEIVDLA